jgi:hypothetical protein
MDDETLIYLVTLQIRDLPSTVEAIFRKEADAEEMIARFREEDAREGYTDYSYWIQIRVLR